MDERWGFSFGEQIDWEFDMAARADERGRFSWFDNFVARYIAFWGDAVFWDWFDCFCRWVAVVGGVGLLSVFGVCCFAVLLEFIFCRGLEQSGGVVGGCIWWVGYGWSSGGFGGVGSVMGGCLAGVGGRSFVWIGKGGCKFGG